MKNSITVKVDKSGLSRIAKDIRDKAVSREVLTDIGETVVRMTRRNARTGKTGDGSSFPPLSKSWIEERENLAQFNDVHLAYETSRSNATFSGQLIDAIEYNIEEQSKSVTIDFNDSVRERYTGESGNKIGEAGITNKEVAQHFLDRGIKIIGLTQEMRDRINFILTSAIRSLLK